MMKIKFIVLLLLLVLYSIIGCYSPDRTCGSWRYIGIFIESTSYQTRTLGGVKISIKTDKGIANVYSYNCPPFIAVGDSVFLSRDEHIRLKQVNKESK